MICSREEALAAGMTHEGTICGVPCWMKPTEHGAIGIPKFLPLQLWMDFVSWLYGVAAFFTPSDCYLEFPIKIGKPIQ